MVQHFYYYDDWKSTLLECPNCGWRGTFKQGVCEIHDDLVDCCRPRCEDSPVLAIVSFPTFEETEANLDKLAPSERDDFHTAEGRWRRWEAGKLNSPSQLPELEGYGPLELTWDQEGQGLEGYTVIRHGDQEVWRELVVFEGYERFEEILGVLKARYGSRLMDVMPTERSLLYLWGDRFDAPERIEAARRRLRDAWS